MGCNCKGWPEEALAASVMVMVEVPEGVMIGGGGWRAVLLPPPQPAKANAAHKTAAERTPKSAKWFLSVARSNAR